MRTRIGLSLLALMLPAPAAAQLKTLRVVSSDGEPIPYAWVSIRGGTRHITDENGRLSLGTGKAETVTVSATRIGYQPWIGKLELPDTTATLSVALTRVAQSLSTVTVKGDSPAKSHLQLTGFYDRAMMREKGLLSAVFIGPEEIEFRHPSGVSDLLRGLNGVVVNRGLIYGYNGQCAMTILVDGTRQCPPGGCHVNGGGNVAEVMGGGQKPDVINLDQLVFASEVAAIEVYARGANMPISLQTSDNGCGVVAIWTGSRRQP